MSHKTVIFSVLHQKPCIKTRKVINRGKRSTTLNEEELVENIRICRVFQRQVSHKKMPFLYVSCKTTNHFGLEKDNPSQRLESIESSKLVLQRTSMLGEFDSRRDSH